MEIIPADIMDSKLKSNQRHDIHNRDIIYTRFYIRSSDLKSELYILKIQFLDQIMDYH